MDSLAALLAWAGLSADTFVHTAEPRPTRGALTMIPTCLKGDPQLFTEAAAALDQLVKAAYERMRNPR